MFIDTVKTYACKVCECGVEISECEYDAYEGESLCPHCDNPSIEVIYQRPARWFSVAIYSMDRAYGGPEEGGWYYDVGHRVDETVRIFYNTAEGIYEAKRYVESLHALQFPTRATRYGYQCYSSRVYSEELPAAGFPNRRPVYC